MDTKDNADIKKSHHTLTQSETNAVEQNDMDAKATEENHAVVDEEVNESFHVENSESDDQYIDLLIVDLPDVALVRLMEYLNLKERYYLSMTCKLFYNLFTHPQLWQIANIDLYSAGTGATKDYTRWKLKHVMNSTMIEIVKRFSHIFKHLSLKLNDNIQRFEEVSATLLQEMRYQCQLESLSIKLGPLTSDNVHIRRIMSYRSDPKDVPIVVGLIHSATRLKRLNIVSWPLSLMMDDSNILLAIQSNGKLKNLESLSLFFIDLKKQTWTERIPKLPSIEQTLDVICFLPNLTHLALRSPMINDETILLLSSLGRKQLKLLQVLVMYAVPFAFHDGFALPEIASSSWQKLKKFSPRLQVEFVLLTRIPWDQFQVMLKPEVPLSSLSLMNYSQCESVMIESLATHYKSTLKSFKSFCDSHSCDHALKRLVKECQGLTSLAYHGVINYKTVMELADLLKPVKDNVDLFQFNNKRIETDNLEEDDEDIVVKFDNVNQRYYLKSVDAWHIDEDDNQRKLNELVEHVREALGTASNLFYA